MSANARTAGERIFDVANTVFLIALGVVLVYPALHVLSLSVSTPQEAVRAGFHFYPREVTFEGLVQVVSQSGIWRGFLNSFHRTIFGGILHLLFTSLAAYALAKKTLPFRRLIFTAIIFTMYFRGGLIPSYMVIRYLGLLDTRLAMILPHLVFGFNLIIMRSFFENIPPSLEEAARAEGAGEFYIFFKLIIPVSTAVFATIGLWISVFHWNAYLDNLIYIKSPSRFVLQRYIRNLLIDLSLVESDMNADAMDLTLESVRASTIVIASIPIMLLYPFVQKYFMKGVMLGSVKG